MPTKDNNTLTQARLKELLHYDPDTGVFTWRRSNSEMLDYHPNHGKEV